MSDSQQAPHGQPRKKSVFKRPILFGCLAFLVVLALVIGAALIWLFTAGKAMIAQTVHDEVLAHIEQSDLSDYQKNALRDEVERLNYGFQEGDISLREMVLIADELSQSPAISVLKLTEAEGDPLEASTLSQDEKDDARHTINRFVHGVFEDLIPASAVDDLVDPLLLEPDSKEVWKFRNNITDEELRSTIRKAKEWADRAGVDNSNLEPDVAGEVQSIINRVLQGQE